MSSKSGGKRRTNIKSRTAPDNVSPVKVEKFKRAERPEYEAPSNTYDRSDRTQGKMPKFKAYGDYPPEPQIISDEFVKKGSEEEKELEEE